MTYNLRLAAYVTLSLLWYALGIGSIVYIVDSIVTAGGFPNNLLGAMILTWTALGSAITCVLAWTWGIGAWLCERWKLKA